ncbi:MAG: EutN/CcmL family microcompartment protein [Deltaproteobacteria bacterium]
MILGRVVGTVVASAKHPGYVGYKLMLVQPIDERGKARGDEIIAVDNAQAGIGDTVLVLKEGNGVRQILVGDLTATLPILETIVGIVDTVDVPGVTR